MVTGEGLERVEGGGVNMLNFKARTVGKIERKNEVDGK